MMDTPTEPRPWLERTLRQALREAPENHLADFGGQRIFGRPIVGIADGDDPLFGRFRQVVSPGHLMPRDVVEHDAPPGAGITRIRVIVWALPFAEEVRRSNRAGRWPSRLYSLARNNGGALNFMLRGRMAEALREAGWTAVAPLLTERYDAFRSPDHTFSSSWSERHAAYAAGLGQFGLSGSLITRVGAHVRLGSLVTNMPVEPTPRPYDDYRAPCLADGGRSCGVCIGRCPVGAISERGLDKEKCYEMRKAVRARSLEDYTTSFDMLRAPILKGGTREDGHSLGCALCQCSVPCEGGIPASSGES